ncbi:MAG: hypothetical protein Q9168_005513 [Polycauliona sp. 1 TL-2023]
MSTLNDQLQHIEALKQILNAIKTAVSANDRCEPVLGLLEVMLLNISYDTTVLKHAQSIVNREDDLEGREAAFEENNAKLKMLEVKLKGIKELNDAKETTITAREQALTARERNFNTQIASQFTNRLQRLDRATERLEGLTAIPGATINAKKPDEMQRIPRPAAPDPDSDSDRPLIESSPHRIRVQQPPSGGYTGPTKRQLQTSSADTNPGEAANPKSSKLEAHRPEPSAARQKPNGANAAPALHDRPKASQESPEKMTFDMGRKVKSTQLLPSLVQPGWKPTNLLGGPTPTNYFAPPRSQAQRLPRQMIPRSTFKRTSSDD